MQTSVATRAFGVKPVATVSILHLHLQLPTQFWERVLSTSQPGLASNHLNII